MQPREDLSGWTLNIFELLPSYYNVYKRLQQAGYKRVGVVIQANVMDSQKILEDLTKLNPNIRLVKGAYSISEEAGFTNKADVDTNYRRIILKIKKINKLGINKIRLKVATHDEKMISYAQRKGFTDFEFLKGIAINTKIRLVAKYFNISDYGPVDLRVGGKSHWFKYFTRRIGEHPANLEFLRKHL